MKIVALIGSLRKDSYNRKVFAHYRQAAAGQFEIVEGTFADFPLYNQEIEETDFPASVEKLGKLIREADGLIFFSPEYNHSMPGVLKNAIDWLSRLDDSPFDGKPATVISASPGRLGGALMQYALRQSSVGIGLRMLSSPEVMVAEAHKRIDEKTGEIKDEATVKILAKHRDAFAAFAREHSAR